MSFTQGEHGFYDSETTPLHALDPRLKVLSSLLFVILSFSSSNLSQLLVPTSALALALYLCPRGWSKIARACWMLRWLLLFTLVIYLLFSPGRTLWGLSWLSYDGLLNGLLVCAQITASLVASLLLALTTSPEQISGAFGWLLRPLQWFGVKIESWQRLLLLSQQFLPVVGDEAQAIITSKEGKRAAMKQALHRLIDKGDQIAQTMVADGTHLQDLTALPKLLPLGWGDRLLTFTLLAVLVLGWLVGAAL